MIPDWIYLLVGIAIIGVLYETMPKLGAIILIVVTLLALINGEKGGFKTA